MRILTRTGDHRWISDTSVEITDNDGKAQGAIGILQDITERKRTESELENLVIELEKRNTELERFNYTLSHELKTPLVTIRGFLGYLEDSASKNDIAKVKADAIRIAKATDKMHDMINELLDLSRVGYVIKLQQHVPFSEIVSEGLRTLESFITERKIEINIAPDLPMVHGDRTRLAEVIQNLVTNAVKYMGDQTSPLIKIGAKPLDKNGNIAFFVKDNGMGIAPEYHQIVFGLFDKLDPQSEGTGIGLALVKRIIETHGGRIWVESDGLGKGSTFFFTIPENKNQ
jgi:signal transduction histidine kinase